jgi:hypothetical protein
LKEVITKPPFVMGHHTPSPQHPSTTQSSGSRSANVQANKSKLIDLVAKKRIVGIACFYEQDLKSRDPQIVYGVYDNDHDEATRLKCEEENKGETQKIKSSTGGP